MPPMPFDSPDIARHLASTDHRDLDRLPYGVVRLTRDGLVAFYSDTEARQSGFNRRPALGLDFFDEVAPCMNDPLMKGLIEHSWRDGNLDLELGWIGDPADPERSYRIRAVSADDGGVWLLMQRDET